MGTVLPSSSSAVSTGTLITPSVLLALANIRKGPNGKWSSDPRNVPTTSRLKQHTVITIRRVRVGPVITWPEGSVGQVPDLDGPERPPARSAAPVVVAVAMVVALVAAAVAVVVLRRAETDPVGLAPIGPAPFGADGAITAGPSRAWYSADGAKLAVLTGGAAALAEEGQVRLLTARGGNVVDLAWFSAGTALLVAEGPAPTGGLAVVATSGEIRGRVPIDASISFGTGYGMSIAPGGRRAVVTTVSRGTFGEEESRLVEIDLTTGAATPLDTGVGDARHPHHLDAGRVAFTRVTDAGSEAVVRSIGSGAPGAGAEIVLGDGEVRGVIGAGEAVVLQDGATLRSVAADGGGDDRTLAREVAGRVVAVHPSGATAVTAVRRGDVAVLQEISLVRGGST